VSRRYAIVDLGTNSARLLVADVPKEGAWQSVADERIACRLGEGLRDTGQIQPAAEHRTSEALQTLVSHALDLGDVTLCVLATHTLRAATNGAAVRERFEKTMGQPIKLISGEQEAALVLRTAQLYLSATPGEPLVAVDLGGGSLEFAVQPSTPTAESNDSQEHGHNAPELLSLALGSVVMSDGLPSGVISPEEVQALRTNVREMLQRQAPGLRGVANEVAMAGGTAVCAAAVLGYPAPWTGVRLETAALEELILTLARMDLHERTALPGVGDRADIIVAGVAVLTEALQHLGATHGIVLQHGVREGALLALAQGEL
jgi:exopolyphosphatase/guanosine-5'-triphosphate,3'-diphosphate pyrophosphatase